MGIFLLWLVLSIVIGIVGNKRTIGFGLAFFWSLLLSPLIGLIITLCYPTKADVEYKERMLRQMQQLKEAMRDKEPTEQEFNPYYGIEINSKVMGRAVTYTLLNGRIEYSDGKRGYIKCMPNGEASIKVDGTERTYTDCHYAADALYDLIPTPIFDDDYYVMELPPPKLTLSGKIKAVVNTAVSMYRDR